MVTGTDELSLAKFKLNPKSGWCDLQASSTWPMPYLTPRQPGRRSSHSPGEARYFLTPQSSVLDSKLLITNMDLDSLMEYEEFHIRILESFQLLIRIWIQIRILSVNYRLMKKDIGSCQHLAFLGHKWVYVVYTALSSIRKIDEIFHCLSSTLYG